MAIVRIDPVLSHNFLVTFVDSTSVLATVASGLQNLVVGGFSECSGLEGSVQVEEYKEGGNNATTLKFPGRMNWSNITLKHGVTINTGLWSWYSQYMSGRGKRRDGLIVLQNDQLLPIAVWSFKRGIPVKWTGPQLNATQNSVAITSLEIAHEGLDLLTALPDPMDLAGSLDISASVSLSGGIGG
jgi:phage tail-like protein